MVVGGELGGDSEREREDLALLCHFLKSRCILCLCAKHKAVRAEFRESHQHPTLSSPHLDQLPLGLLLGH